VKYATAAAFRTALEQRLLTASRQGEVSLVLLRKLVAFEQLLARLLVVAPDRWILKGAVALHFRLGTRFRTTKDIDLGRWDDERAAAEDFAVAEQVDLGDHFRFVTVRTTKLDQLLEGAAVRYHVSAYVAGRRFEELAVDVGFSDPPTMEPERLRGPDLLSFAEIEAVEVPALPLAPHVAEKVHAYTRSYSGGASTHVKDLVDLVLIPSRFPLDAGPLWSALRTTFDARATHPLPAALPPPPDEWRTGYRRMAAEAGLDPDVLVGYGQARAFLDPVLAGTAPDNALWVLGRWTW
jgi:hypothetical protein